MAGHRQTTRALVLGSSGRVGRMLRQAWAKDSAGIEFAFQTRYPSAACDLLWDVLDAPPDAVVQSAPFDAMIVLSGVVPGPDADVTRNAAIGCAAILAAAKLCIPMVFLASSSAVYGGGRPAAFHEADATAPVNAYGEAKLAMEVQCRAQARSAGVRLCLLRIGNVAGADALLLNARKLAPGQRLAMDVFADGGTPVRSYIGPQSFAQVICTLIHGRDAVPEVLNIAAQRPVSMRALAESAAVPFDLRPAPATAQQHITLDCAVLAALHQFAPADSDPDEMVRQYHDTSSPLSAPD